MECSRRSPWLLGDEYLEHKRASVSEFISESEYLGLGDNVYPEIIKTLEQVFADEYSEAILCWGIGAGKSFLAALALSYMTHSILCIKDPAGALGLAPGSAITLMVVAPSARHARDVVFENFRTMVSNSPWFKACASSAVYKATEALLPKNLRVIAGNSSLTFPLGHNVLGAVMDEAAWFPTCEGGRNELGEEMHGILRRRISSRFASRGLLVVISSPRVQGDYFERRLVQAQDDPQVFVSRRASWDVRTPDLYCGEKFTWNGIAVPVEHERDFATDPNRAARDFAALASRPEFPYLHDLSKLDSIIDPLYKQPFEFDGSLAQWFKPQDNACRYLHIDLGLTRDACGIAMASAIPGNAEKGTQVRVELMQQLLPPTNGELDLSQPRELIMELVRRGFQIAQVSYDGWQSADSRQQLIRQGVRCVLASVDRTMEAYDTLRELICDGRLHTYHYEPFLREITRLEVVGGGKKIDHPAGGSKDVADAVAGAVFAAVRANQGNVLRGHVL